MKQIFIDKFFVPKNAVEEFTQRMNYNRSFLKTLSGFLGDSGYQRTDEHGNLIVITIATWESKEALTNAKEAVQMEYQRIGFNSSEMFTRLHITMDRGIYNEINS